MSDWVERFQIAGPDLDQAVDEFTAVLHEAAKLAHAHPKYADAVLRNVIWAVASVPLSDLYRRRMSSVAHRMLLVDGVRVAEFRYVSVEARTADGRPDVVREHIRPRVALMKEVLVLAGQKADRREYRRWTVHTMEQIVVVTKGEDQRLGRTGGAERYTKAGIKVFDQKDEMELDEAATRQRFGPFIAGTPEPGGS